MKVAIYVRVSTHTQEGKNQEVQIIEYCKRMGYEVYNIYSDVMSGKENSRPAFDKLFVDARKMLFDIVVFWDLSRFSRAGTLFTLQKLKELSNIGVKWHSLQEPYFSSLGEFGDVIISIMATLSKIERQKISERTKAGLAKAKNVGKRGKDKRPRKRRSDKGIKRGVQKA